MAHLAGAGRNSFDPPILAEQILGRATKTPHRFRQGVAVSSRLSRVLLDNLRPHQLIDVCQVIAGIVIGQRALRDVQIAEQLAGVIEHLT